MNHWNTLAKEVNPKRAGYSDMRTWPAQMLYYHVILLSIFMTGNIIGSVIVVTVPALLIAYLAAHFQQESTEKTTFDVEGFIAAVEAKPDIPSDDFKIITPGVTRKEYVETYLPTISTIVYSLSKNTDGKITFKKPLHQST